MSKKFDLDNYISFSSAVNEIQNGSGTEQEEARYALINLAKEDQKKKAEIKLLEQKLNQAKAESGIIQRSVQNVFDVIKRKKPLAVILEEKIIVFSDRDITIEKNVL